MRKEAEGGAIGSAQALAYTRSLIAGVQFLYVALVIYDAWKGPGLLRAALHFESKVWAVVYVLLAGWLPRGFAASAVGIAYTRYTGLAYVQDRIGFARAGGSDIAYWVGFLCFQAALVTSYAIGYPTWTGLTRGLVLAVFATASSVFLSSLLSRALFSRMFGPKVQGSLWRT
jgi:hypothetical protein